MTARSTYTLLSVESHTDTMTGRTTVAVFCPMCRELYSVHDNEEQAKAIYADHDDTVCVFCLEPFPTPDPA